MLGFHPVLGSVLVDNRHQNQEPKFPEIQTDTEHRKIDTLVRFRVGSVTVFMCPALVNIMHFVISNIIKIYYVV
jgi:hypothetical protein